MRWGQRGAQVTGLGEEEDIKQGGLCHEAAVDGRHDQAQLNGPVGRCEHSAVERKMHERKLRGGGVRGHGSEACTSGVSD